VRIRPSVRLHHSANRNARLHRVRGQPSVAQEGGDWLQRCLVIVHVSTTGVPEQVRMPFVWLESLGSRYGHHDPTDGPHV
jgi:hypothetical protein